MSRYTNGGARTWVRIYELIFFTDTKILMQLQAWSSRKRLHVQGASGIDARFLNQK